MMFRISEHCSYQGHFIYDQVFRRMEMNRAVEALSAFLQPMAIGCLASTWRGDYSADFRFV